MSKFKDFSKFYINIICVADVLLQIDYTSPFSWLPYEEGICNDKITNIVELENFYFNPNATSVDLGTVSPATPHVNQKNLKKRTLAF